MTPDSQGVPGERGRPGMPDLAALASVRHAEARGWRGQIAEAAGARVAALARDTVCLTLLAGSGSRWVKSLQDARKVAPPGSPEREFPDDAPRGLFPVRNFLGDGRALVPVASYAIDAVRGLGRHLVVVRGWDAEIARGVLAPLGIRPDRYGFFTQEPGASGKPLGHGDAAWQCRAEWAGARYVVANFGGDANSPLTAMESLIALDELVRRGEDADFLLPVARVDAPAYPVDLDERGLPRGFGHDKLGGPAGRAARTGGYVNVGIRVYRAEALLRAMELIRARWWSPESGYRIPGNDPSGGEFALDNADAMFALEGRARVLAIAEARELTPAKSHDAIPAFEEAARGVRAEWDEWRLRTGFRRAT